MPTYHPILNIKPFENLKWRDKAWWTDTCGHEWETKYDSIKAGQGCPICAGKIILPGFNDLKSQAPKIAAEWHPTKNDFTPENIAPKSSKKAWWLGVCGHEWEAKISNRTAHNSGCPICIGRIVLPGFNDLASLDAPFVQEWHPTKNLPLTPDQISRGNPKKVWWLGECGHEWETTIQHRNQGKKCPICLNKTIISGFNDLLTINPDLASEWHINLNTHKYTEISLASGYMAWWQCIEGHEWKARVVDRKRGNGCPSCSSHSYSSKAEKELISFLKPYCEDITLNARSLIHPYEVDMYIPSKQIAIEYNGLYWHNEKAGKDSKYHYNKWKACRDKGIQLIQIWEDDWNRNPELIKNMLLRKLQVSKEPKIFGRNTKIDIVTQKQSNIFLNEHHIQGAVDGGIRVGLFENITLLDTQPNLVAVMVLKREPGTEDKTLNLLRFATSAPIPGGFTKLLKHVEKTYNPQKIITFSDNTISNGNLYATTGFTVVKEIKPDYMYIFDRKRNHKFRFRLKRFKNDPNLKFEENLSEKELALLNNLDRIWDAGKIKWEKQYVVPKTP